MANNTKRYVGSAAAIAEATKNLPNGWSILIHVNTINAHVYQLVGPFEGDYFEDDDMADSLKKELRNAVARAKAVQAEIGDGRICPDCGCNVMDAHTEDCHHRPSDPNANGVNCPDCGGDGFESYEVGDDTPCVLCSGTGKVPW